MLWEEHRLLSGFSFKTRENVGWNLWALMSTCYKKVQNIMLRKFSVLNEEWQIATSRLLAGQGSAAEFITYSHFSEVLWSSAVTERQDRLNKLW
jgi:hypothetical protein